MNIFIINLKSASYRNIFQKKQLFKLGLNFEFLDATSVDEISEKTYKKYRNNWQRPMRDTEVACYLSHRNAWDKVVESNQPALILEDDALLSKYVPEILDILSDRGDVDLITLENRGRKKFVAKLGVGLGGHSTLLRLYQDRTGAAGYVIYPSGAKKLIEQQNKKGIALADAHITACHSLKAFQVEPSPIVQLDICKYYGIENSHSERVGKIIDSVNKPKGNWIFWIKRNYYQVKMGLRQLVLLIKSERRYIKLNKSDFS